jgi:hypothetical protein
MAKSISTSVIALGITTFKGESKQDHQWIRFTDGLVAEGITSEDFKDAEFANSFKVAVVLPSFTKQEQALMSAPIKSLSEEQKVSRRYLQQQIGSRVAKVVTHLRKREAAEDDTADNTAATAKPKSKKNDLGAKLKADLVKWIDRVERAEAVTFSAVKMLEHLRSASALIKE